MTEDDGPQLTYHRVFQRHSDAYGRAFEHATADYSRARSAAAQRQARGPGCHWWNRWWHQRQRQADVLFLLPAFRVAAEQRARFLPFGTPEHTREVERQIDRAFAYHKTLPGNGHWRCGCAQAEADDAET